MMPSEDELSTLYCLLCETVEVAEDHSWVAYTLRPEARWHGRGVPVTVDDVVWTFETLKTDGPLSFKANWGHVEGIERLGERSFRFLFAEGARSRRAVMEASAFLPMAKHYWRDRGLHGDQPGGAAGQRPLPRQGGRPRSASRVRARSGLLGEGPQLQARVPQLRPHRRPLLPGHEGGNPGAQGPRRRLLARSGRTRGRHRLRLPRGRDGALQQGDLPDADDLRDALVGGLQHSPAAVRGHPRARGADPGLQLRLGQPHPCSTAPCVATARSSSVRRWRRGACRHRRNWRCWNPCGSTSRNACSRTSSRCRRTTATAATGRR